MPDKSDCLPGNQRLRCSSNAAMKRMSRTTLLLAPVIVVPILASAMVNRSRESASLAALRANELPALESEDTQKRSVIISGALPATQLPRFQMFKVQGRKSIAELESRLGPELFAATLKINRLDKKHLRGGEWLVVPDSNADAANASPFPPAIEAARSISKLILVSRREQAFGVYESGKLVRWGPTSTGKKSTPTPAGLYHANWKARETRSSINASWILPWAVNIDNRSGVALHQFDLPGYPASHGCVRLLEADAKWIYDWAEPWMLSKTSHSLLAHGTPVVIFGDYSYGERPPWKRLADDPAATVISIAEIEESLNQYAPAIASRALARESMIAQLAQPTN